MFYYSRDRAGEHPQAHLANYSGILQANAYTGYGQLYLPDRSPGPIHEAACWAHARRPFFAQADLESNARRKAQGKSAAVISPVALKMVQRIDALFEIERHINGRTADERKAIRQQLSKPLIGDMEIWISSPSGHGDRATRNPLERSVRWSVPLIAGSNDLIFIWMFFVLHCDDPTANLVDDLADASVFSC